MSWGGGGVRELLGIVPRKIGFIRRHLRPF